MGRIDSQTLELDFQRTAVRYRYSVQTAAEVPRSPKKPIALLVGIGSVLGAILVALLSAATADWLTGRVLETWQVRRRLKLEVLGEFDQPG
jgi:capsular polysaccharide biosynthesis protein